MKKEDISRVMSYLAKRSVEARRKGKTKEQISEYYRQMVNKRYQKNEKQVSRKV